MTQHKFHIQFLQDNWMVRESVFADFYFNHWVTNACCINTGVFYLSIMYMYILKMLEYWKCTGALKVLRQKPSLFSTTITGVLIY